MPSNRWFTAVPVPGAVLFTAAAIITAWHGHATIAVLLGLNGLLIISYLVRHRMRAELIYNRHPQVPDQQPDQRLSADTAASGRTPAQSRQHAEPADRQ